MDRALSWFIRLWVGLVLIANVIAVVGFFLTASSFWAGVAKVQDMYSPFNVVNWLAEILSLSPALGALYWRDKRRKQTTGAGTRRPP